MKLIIFYFSDNNYLKIFSLEAILPIEQYSPFSMSIPSLNHWYILASPAATTEKLTVCPGRAFMIDIGCVMMVGMTTAGEGEGQGRRKGWSRGLMYVQSNNTERMYIMIYGQSTRN